MTSVKAETIFCIAAHVIPWKKAYSWDENNTTKDKQSRENFSYTKVIKRTVARESFELWQEKMNI